MEKKFNSGKFASFFKKNGYLILMMICLAAIATMIALTMIKNDKAEQGTGLSNDQTVIPVINDGKEEEGEREEQSGDATNTAVVTAPTLISTPMENAEVLKAYTETELVYNATMKHWATHQGVDYKADAGAPVKAVFDGEVISVTTTTLKGTTVVVKHPDGLESTYSLLGTNVTVKAGDKVKKGDVLGYISESGIFETADGPHLHFELRKDGKLVDPELFSEEGNK